MNNVDKVLFEQYVNFTGLSFDEGMEYLKLLFNTRDFNNPLFKSENFINNELVIANFIKEDGYIFVSGAYSLDNGKFTESRSFITKIYDDESSIKFVTTIIRLGEIIDNKKYFVVEKFIKKENGYNRYTIYDDGKFLKEYKRIGMELDSKELDSFIFNKTNIGANKKVL